MGETDKENSQQPPREGVLRIYVAALCALVEGLADAADIDLDDTKLSVSADGKSLAEKSAREIMDAAKRCADFTTARHTEGA